MTIFVLGALEKDPQPPSLVPVIYAPVFAFPPEIVAAIVHSGFTPEILELMMQYYAGGDLWKSCDGVNWTSVTINGFNNRYNYGIREVIPVQSKGKDTGLAVGTANPFTGQPNGGCEVWLEDAVTGREPAWAAGPALRPKRQLGHLHPLRRGS